jgi:hypothetical protein
MFEDKAKEKLVLSVIGRRCKGSSTFIFLELFFPFPWDSNKVLLYIPKKRKRPRWPKRKH